ncbi:MAG: hypothetical protein KGI38_03820 [Thaumarchaeota archaeon]|nr:hypothetical protein [Nitrososphaerota archaeon]
MEVTDVSAEKRVPLLSLLRLIAGSWKYRLVLLASILGYWASYSLSVGMFFYYSFDLAPLLKSVQVPNPYFIMYTQSFMGFYDSGMIWYPTNHLQVNLLIGPAFFSAVLSVLFGLNMMLVGYSVSTRVSTRNLGLSSLAAVVPALFSGGCCAVPFGTILLASFIPTAALGTFVYSYVAVTNSLFAVLLFSSLVYNARKLGSCCVPR